MTWRAPRDGRLGQPAVFSDAAVQFCLSIKVLFKLPLRQTAGMVASLLRLAGLDWPVPDFSTLSRRQKALAVQIPYRRADGLLNLARGQHRYKVARRGRMAGAQACGAGAAPVVQGATGQEPGHVRHPRHASPGRALRSNVPKGDSPQAAPAAAPYYRTC
jgi:hypothetical protein